MANIYKGRKILGARLHAFAFIGGTQIGPDVKTEGTTKPVSIEVQDSFIQLTFKNASALIPMANVIQIELGPEVKETKK